MNNRRKVDKKLKAEEKLEQTCQKKTEELKYGIGKLG